MRGARMRQVVIALVSCTILCSGKALAEPVRAAYPSANVQFLPAFVSLERGFYKREGLDAELISVRSAVTAVQALVGNQIHFIFSVGPQMPAIWENRYHPSRSASGSADFLSGRAARDPESFRSQRKK